MSTTLAFIGTGIMGLPMATHLLNAGHPLTVHTRTRAKAQALFDQGAKWADSPAAAAQAADVIFLNLPDTPDVEKVIAGHGGIVYVARPNQIIIDHSTISPAAARNLAALFSKQGASFLDAPVSGGDVGARNASLSIMVGGDEAAFQRALPLLQLLGKTITHTGPSGSGQLTKLVNQVLVGGTLLAVCEALVFASRNGLDLQKTLDCVSAGAAGSWQLQNLGPRIVRGDFDPGFMIDLMHKDLRLLLEASQHSNLTLPLASLAHQQFSAAQSAGLGRQGTQAVYAVLDRAAKPESR
jgi:3-hydroxyisobutyrate dehydrogenase